MRELRDKQLDQDIERTLRFETLIMPEQQRAARERLLQRAAQQSVLTPATEEEAVSRLIEVASQFKQRSLKLLNILILDSTAFERVPRKPVHFYYFLDTHGRFTRPILSLSA